MIFVFPIAGKGERTRTIGEYKPLIQIAGRPILYWALLSILQHIQKNDTFIFITTEWFNEKFRLQAAIKDILFNLKCKNDFKILTTHDTPPGPAKTVYHAKSDICIDEAVVVINCDQFIVYEMPSELKKNTGFLPIYAEFSNKSSYVQINNNLITKIVEKCNISNLASAGVYGVDRGESLITALEEMFKKCDKYNDEYYVGPSINYLIKKGYKIVPTQVIIKYDLGSISGIKQFTAFLNQIKMYLPHIYD